MTTEISNSKVVININVYEKQKLIKRPVNTYNDEQRIIKSANVAQQIADQKQVKLGKHQLMMRKQRMFVHQDLAFYYLLIFVHMVMITISGIYKITTSARKKAASGK